MIEMFEAIFILFSAVVGAFLAAGGVVAWIKGRDKEGRFMVRWGSLVLLLCALCWKADEHEDEIKSLQEQVAELQQAEVQDEQ